MLARTVDGIAALVRALLHRADLALEVEALDTARLVLGEATQLLDRGVEAPAMVVRYHRCAAATVAAAAGDQQRAGAEAERARLLARSIAHPRVAAKPD